MVQFPWRVLEGEAMFSFIKRKINNWIVKRRETKRREAEVKKQSVIYHLERCWTPLEIHDRNIRMIVNSAGWLGGTNGSSKRRGTDMKAMLLVLHPEHNTEKPKPPPEYHWTPSLILFWAIVFGSLAWGVLWSAYTTWKYLRRKRHEKDTRTAPAGTDAGLQQSEPANPETTTK